MSESSPIHCRQFGPAKPLAGGAGAGGRGLREADGVRPADLPRPPAGGVAVHRPADQNNIQRTPTTSFSFALGIL